MSSTEYLPITLVKEYYWCPLKAYYRLTTWRTRPTESMETGKQLQGMHRAKIIELLEKHHAIREALWEHPVASKRLGLAGRIDLAAITTKETIIVLDMKLAPTTKKKLLTRDKHIAAQLAAYAIAAEETLRKPLEKAYIYTIENQELVELKMTPMLRGLVEHAATQLHRINQGHQPAPTPSKRRCATCEYNTICPYRR